MLTVVQVSEVTHLIRDEPPESETIDGALVLQDQFSTTAFNPAIISGRKYRRSLPLGPAMKLELGPGRHRSYTTIDILELDALAPCAMYAFYLPV